MRKVIKANENRVRVLSNLARGTMVIKSKKVYDRKKKHKKK